MEMGLGNQQFVTLLLYLDDICVFFIDEMLDQIEIVFKRLREFNLKIKPKKCQLFQHSIIFLGYVFSVDASSANYNKVAKVQKVASANQPKKKSILKFGILLSPVYS